MFLGHAIGQPGHMSVTAPPTSKYLGIYLNDHLMGSTTGTQLVQRIASEHEGSEDDAVAEHLGRDRLADLAARAADQRERAQVHRRAAARRAFMAG